MAFQASTSSDYVSDSDDNYSNSTLLRSVISDSGDECVVVDANSDISVENVSSSLTSPKGNIPDEKMNNREHTIKNDNCSRNSSNIGNRIQNSFTVGNRSQEVLSDTSPLTDQLLVGKHSRTHSLSDSDDVHEKSTVHTVSNSGSDEDEVIHKVKSKPKHIFSSDSNESSPENDIADKSSQSERSRLVKNNSVQSLSKNKNIFTSDVGTPEDDIADKSSRLERSRLFQNNSAKSFSSKSKITFSSDSEEENISTKRVVSKKTILVNSDSETESDKQDLLSASKSEKYRISKNLSNKTLLKPCLSPSGFEKENADSNTVITARQLDSYPLSQNTVNSPERLDRTRISQDFKDRRLLCSTFVEALTPINKETGKRLLHTPTDTPRILKHDKKEATAYRTPKTDTAVRDAFTPREVTQIILSSSEDSSNEDIIDISDDEAPPKPKTKQPTLKELISKGPVLMDNKNVSESIEVTPQQYQEQEQMVRRLGQDLEQASTLMSTLNMEHLPDKGQSLRNRYLDLQRRQKEADQKLSKMKIKTQVPNLIVEREVPSWGELEAGAGRVQPNTFGKQAMSTYNHQKAMTIDRLQQLHGSLKTCPKESDQADPPKGLTVELMDHQLRALSWLIWREEQKPSGGILADDMGLGKTLTMISLMLKCNEIEKAHDDDDDDDDEDENDENSEKKFKVHGGTLIVCPASLLQQWSSELERRTKRGVASCEIYHGPKREKKPKNLAQYDMVVTTYSLVNNENEKNGAIFRMKWRRIIIDEAHQIRNHKSRTSEAVCRLAAKSRWALTGTPVHNKELDMYALLKFLRCTPFDELPVWKRWVGDKSTGGTERLHTVISSLMLRRTKPELIEKGILNVMPERKWELVPVDLSKSERDVYSKILIFSRTLFAQFLHQRAEKDQDARDFEYADTQDPNGPNNEYFLMRQKLLRLNKLKDIKQHEILVLLLRLRQVCNHPHLITGMLHEGMEILGDDDSALDKEGAVDLLDQLNRLTIDEEEPTGTSQVAVTNEEGSTLKEVVKNVLSPSDPVFSKTNQSSKIKMVLTLLQERVIKNDDKAIIVSQWPSFLNLISYHLKQNDIKYDQLDGSVPVVKRMEMVDKINNPRDKSIRILLLSLTAGGVGLNLVGANHLMLLDLHWNPQLESQAQDRIYRVGQQKPVYIYKLMASDTIEKRILDLQEKKLGIANSMLTGTVQAAKNKLTLQDLKMLFEM